MKSENEKLAPIPADAGTIAVASLSHDPSRASRRTAAYMQEAGCRIIPVNPGTDSALGGKDHPGPGAFTERVDIVNIFQRSEKIPALVDEAIEKRPRAFWMQRGIATIRDLPIKTARRKTARTPR